MELTKEQARKKAGRTHESPCKTEGCNNIAYLTKGEKLKGERVSCSRACANKSRRREHVDTYFKSIKKGAAKRGKDFEIDLDYVKRLFKQQKGLCAITGCTISIPHPSDETLLYEAASLDRIDSNIGYIEGNVQWVLLGINYMKRNFSEEALHKCLKLVSENYMRTHSSVR